MMLVSTRFQEQIRQLADAESVPADASLEQYLSDLGLAYLSDGEHLQLKESLELLDSSRIERAMTESARAGLSGLRIHWSVGSTNTWLMDVRHEPDWHGLVCLAEQQVAGKGRRGRSWVSPFGKNIYMSVGWNMPRNIPGLSGLSLVVGTQVASALASLGVEACRLKWPNDILLDGGKLAGILVELAAPERHHVGVVIGIGVNLRLTPGEMADVDQAWATVSQVREISRNAVVAAILDRLLPALSRFEVEGFDGFREEWEGYDLYRDREVVVHLGDKLIEGIDRGIDRDGNLILETAQGREIFSAGEVSMREG
ncbi:MAG: biotin--[acetyl-CoA-carboxylase] ligase [Pseudomonadales bacterium]|nr:biotin--[acetyl-CoA-carboxylase] ligase [Pseudomonadales bacterium]